MSKELSLCLLTYNCAKNNQLENIHKLVEELPISSTTPDFIVCGFQELTSLLSSVTPFKVQHYLLELSIILEKLFKAKHPNIKLLAFENIGAIGLIVFSVKKYDYYIGKISLGYGYSSLKGAVSIRIKLNEQTEITFVSCHLTANQGISNMIKRNKDFKNLMTNLSFNNNDEFSVLKPNNHVFILGDTNYRSLSESRSLSYSVDLDELNSERIYYKSTFWGFDECKIDFKPTYKLIQGTSDYDSKRIPSWCDRILFLNYINSNIKEEITKNSTYNSITNYKYSDHLPVYLNIKIPMTPPSVEHLMDQDGVLSADYSPKEFITFKPIHWKSSLLLNISRISDLFLLIGLIAIKKEVLSLIILFGLFKLYKYFF